MRIALAVFRFFVNTEKLMFSHSVAFALGMAVEAAIIVAFMTGHATGKALLGSFGL